MTDEFDTMMDELWKLSGRIDDDHRDGHCEHIGDCEKLRGFLFFLDSPEGSGSRADLEDWAEGETAETLYHAAFARGFTASEWVREEEMAAYLEFERTHN